jgi:hypothetical protein
VLLNGSRPSPETTVALLIGGLRTVLPRGIVNPSTILLRAALQERIRPMLKSFLTEYLRCLRHIRGRLTLKILNVE